MDNKLDNEDASKIVDRLNELEIISLKKAIPPRWYGLYWALYIGFWISLPALETTYIYLMFPVSISSVVVYHLMLKKGVKLSMFGTKKGGVFLYAFFILIATVFYFTAKWINEKYSLPSVYLYSGIISAIVVFTFIEYRRQKLTRIFN